MRRRARGARLVTLPENFAFLLLPGVPCPTRSRSTAVCAAWRTWCVVTR